MAMNEAQLTRILRQYKKVRQSDFHEPAVRKASTTNLIGDGPGVVKRHPLSKEERAQAENDLAPGREKGDGNAKQDHTSDVSPVDSSMQVENLIEPSEFLPAFDAWVDSKYPGDRAGATKIKVAFRKQHRATVASLCLEDIEEIAQAVR